MADGGSDFQCRPLQNLPLLTRTGRLKGHGKIGDGHRWDLFPKVSFAPDSLLEHRDSNPSVPLATVSLILAEEKGLQADPARAGTAA